MAPAGACRPPCTLLVLLCTLGQPQVTKNVSLFFLRVCMRTWNSGHWFSPKLVVLWRDRLCFGGRSFFLFAHYFNLIFESGLGKEYFAGSHRGQSLRSEWANATMKIKRSFP